MRRVCLLVIAWVVAVLIGLGRLPGAHIDLSTSFDSFGLALLFAAMTWLLSRHRASSRFFELDAPPTYCMLAGLAVAQYFNTYGVLTAKGTSASDARIQAVQGSTAALLLLAVIGGVLSTLNDRNNRLTQVEHNDPPVV